MLNIVDNAYYKLRAIQICVIFTLVQLLEGYLNFTRSGWIGFAMMMIYAGFDSGASIHRSNHRFWGAVLGLTLSYFLFVLIRINDDLIWLVIPIILFMAYFTVSKHYVTPTIFTVSLTGLGADYYQTDNFAVQTFFEEYFFSTLIAYWFTVVIEYFIFKKTDLTIKFYLGLENRLLHILDNLLTTVSAKKVSNSRFLKLSTSLDSHLARLENFLQTSRHSFTLNEDFYELSTKFDKIAQQVYSNIRDLYINRNKQRLDKLLETEQLMENLRALKRHKL